VGAGDEDQIRPPRSNRARQAWNRAVDAKDAQVTGRSEERLYHHGELRCAAESQCHQQFWLLGTDDAFA
jgi:hypothetical protein